MTNNDAQPTDHGGLSEREFEVAVAIARAEVDESAIFLSSATVTVEKGRVMNSNVGQPCISGTLLQIRLIGEFNIPHGSRPGIDDGPTTAVLITADPLSGLPCLIGVNVGDVAPEPGATVLFPGFD